MLSLRHCSSFAVCCLIVACGQAPPDVAVEPESDQASASDPALGPWQAIAEDSVADDLVLDELRQLEFRSLSKNGSHLLGVMAAPDASALESDGVSDGGGPAATSVPSYDIDVISFAAHERVKYYTDYFLGPARERFNIWLGRMPQPCSAAGRGRRPSCRGFGTAVEHS